jgi:hypothetical protein
MYWRRLVIIYRLSMSIFLVFTADYFHYCRWFCCIRDDIDVFLSGIISYNSLMYASPSVEGHLYCWSDWGVCGLGRWDTECHARW